MSDDRANGAADAVQLNGSTSAGGRLPDFFIVGHSKCGTTALYEMLRRHPQIFMPLKEPRYFAPELRSRYQRLGPGRLPTNLEDYRWLFSQANPEQRAGEASPQYLRSETAARRIAEVQPAAQIIAILREPASFLRSFHLQAVHNHVETQKDFRRAIELEPARRRGKSIPRSSQAPAALLYSNHIRYVEQLRRFHEVFPPEQVLVLIYDDFRADNEGTARAVLRYLQVDDGVALAAVETERLQAVRSVRMHQLNGLLNLAQRKASAGRGASSQAGERQSGARGGRLSELRRRAVYQSPSPADETFMVELRRRFRPEVQALSDYMQRDLITLWGYDALD